MSLISKRFADELVEKDMRDAYLSAQTHAKISHQIRALRLQRGWSQGEFGEKLGKPQSNVSRLESREEGKYTLQTLLELASALDVGLVVEFAAYEDFIRRTSDLSPASLEVPSFSRQALEPLCQDSLQTDLASSWTNLQFFGQSDAARTASVATLSFGDTIGSNFVSYSTFAAPVTTGSALSIACNFNVIGPNSAAYVSNPTSLTGHTGASRNESLARTIGIGDSIKWHSCSGVAGPALEVQTSSDATKIELDLPESPEDSQVVDVAISDEDKLLGVLVYMRDHQIQIDWNRQ